LEEDVVEQSALIGCLGERVEFVGGEIDGIFDRVAADAKDCHALAAGDDREADSFL
jgi:hypothetical protein